jgi:carbohydrate-selective porin OprB
MAGHINILSHTWEAAEDLSTAGQYRFVNLASDTTVELCDAGEAAVGILQNNPESGRPASVMMMGISNVVLGGDVTRLAKLTPDANGDAVATTSDDAEISAIALEAGEDGDVISCFLTIGNTLSGTE